MAWREVIAWASAAVDQRVSPEVRGSKEWTLALFYRRSTLRDLKPSKPPWEEWNFTLIIVALYTFANKLYNSRIP